MTHAIAITRREFVKGIGCTAALGRFSSLVANDNARTGDAIRSIGSDKVLFVDYDLISKSQGVRLKLHPPRKTGERLVVSEHPWESATLNWFSVLRDETRYRMWYECYDIDGWPTADDTSLCYAESVDGIRWTKPKLGLVSYRGNKDNNILFRQVGEGKYRSRVHGSGVFLDPSAAPDVRYKCVSQGLFQGIAERPYFVAGMTSPDGLHWTRSPRPICPVFADSQYSGFWDARQRHYVIFGRVSGQGGRAIGRSVSDRFDTFAPFTRVLEADTHDPADSDLYNPACMPYPGVAGLYLMFPSLFRHRDDVLDIRLAVSHDGVKWTRPDHAIPWISLGQPGDFDGGSLYMGNGGCLRTGDELSFYFSGSALKHAEAELENLRDPKKQRVISRAVARPDRLVSVTAGLAGGQFDTPLIRFVGDRLVVNAAPRPGGTVRVGLLDAAGQPIPRYGVEECQSLKVDNESWIVTWGDRQQVTEQSAQPIRLRIEIRDAEVFGFQFRDKA